MASWAVIIGGFIFVGLGVVHGVLAIADAFRPTQFTPMNDSVRLAMESTGVRFTRGRASMWDAWLGFNISHSLGMLIFGASAVWLGWNLETIGDSQFILLIPAGASLIYFLLSLRFWFYAPAIASGIATACFLAAYWSP